MAGGARDSSKTRVAPVFDLLRSSDSSWVGALLSLAIAASARAVPLPESDLTVLEGYWGNNEKGLDPPISLLSWLIRNVQQPSPPTTSVDANRELLLKRNPKAIAEALGLLRSDPLPSGWHIFEGRTFPDAYIVTPDALIVVEGKRTESAPTTSTKWLPGRHQIWRHIDAAWEMRGHRSVFGLYIVEGDRSGLVPAVWRNAIRDSLTPEALSSSFPHRSLAERDEIAKCLLGVTTWQQVCAHFGLDFASLPDRIATAETRLDDVS